MLAKSNPGLLSQYLLDISLTDTIPPVIASTNLPAEGTTTTGIVDRFTLGFSEDLAANADEHPTEPALSWEEGQGWKTMDWRQYREAVAAATLGLRSIGVGRGDFVAIMTRNRPEHVIGDLAAVHAGATPVSLYNTLAPEQIAYIAGHCEAKVAIVEGREFMERWEKVRADLPALEHVVLLQDADEFQGYEWASSWQELVAQGRAPRETHRGDGA